MSSEDKITADDLGSEREQGSEEKSPRIIPPLEEFLKKAKKETLYDWLHS